jgi:hypothetical protein
VIVNSRTEESVQSAIDGIHTAHRNALIEPLAADASGAARAEHAVRRFPEVDVLFNVLASNPASRTSDRASRLPLKRTS